MAASSRQVFSDVLLAVVGVLVLVLAYGAFTRALNPPVPTSPAGQPLPNAPIHGEVQLEILNGTAEDGLAARTKTFLRTQGGFDVLDTRNANRRDYDSTIVYDRVGNPEAAQHVARALGLAPSRVRSDPRSDLFVDVTVVLGADYLALAPFQSR